MLNNLNNDIEQYFLDGTYKIVPNFGNFKTLVTLIGFNKKPMLLFNVVIHYLQMKHKIYLKIFYNY